MGLKRKRSTTTLSPSPSPSSSSSTTTPSSPISFLPSSSSTTARVLFPGAPNTSTFPLSLWPSTAHQSRHDAPPPHLNSRTYKRHRAAPAADEVHQHTLALLWGGAMMKVDTVVDVEMGEEEGFVREGERERERERGQLSLLHFWQRPVPTIRADKDKVDDDAVMGGA